LRFAGDQGPRCYLCKVHGRTGDRRTRCRQPCPCRRNPHPRRRAIGDSLRDLLHGSAKAAEVKALLQAKGLWSLYLEVGIGPDAEVFTKAQPMAAVGYGA
jgi:hypothetical protein